VAKQPDYRRVGHEIRSYRSDRRCGGSPSRVYHRDDVGTSSVVITAGEVLSANDQSACQQHASFRAARAFRTPWTSGSVGIFGAERH
jgi:hypothetical protein